MKKVALCFFNNTTEEGKNFLCKVHVYLLEKWKGEIRSTKDMMHPAWYKIDDLPVHRMMLADALWVPKAVAGKKISVDAAYGPRQETLIGEVVIGEYLNEVE